MTPRGPGRNSIFMLAITLFSNIKWLHSASVGRAHAEPQVLDLVEMGLGAVLGDIEAEAARRQSPDRLDHGVGGHHPIALRRDEIDARVEQLLLRVQHV